MARTTLKATGLLLPDRRIVTENLSATDSTYQQSGPAAPGASVLPSGAAIGLDGEQAAGVYLELTRGGTPSAEFGARLGWRPSSETVTRGWAPPTWVRYVTGDATQTGSDVLDAIALQSGKLLLLSADGDTGLTQTMTWDPSSDTWAAGANTGYAATAATPTDGLLALWQDPDDSKVYCLQSDVSRPTTRYLLLTSSNDGTAWSLQSEVAFVGSPVLARMCRMWRVHDGAFVLVLIGEDAIQTWRSTNLELWELVGTISDIYDSTNNFPAADAQRLESGEILYVYVVDGAHDTVVHRVAAPFEDPAKVAQVTVADTGSGTVDTISILVEETGRSWIFADDGALVHCYRSTDGRSWSGCAPYYPLSGALTDKAPRRAVQIHGGHALVKATCDSTTSVTPVLVVLGGWDSLEPWMVGAGRPAADPYRLTWGLDSSGSVSWTGTTAVPWSSPDTDGWTITGSGTTPTATPSDSVLTLETTSGTLYYTKTLSGGDSAYVVLDVAQVDGGSNGQPRIGWRVRTDQGSVDALVECRITASGFRLVDVAGTTIASVTYDMQSRCMFAILVESDNRVEIYHKRPHEQTWTSSYQSASVTTATSTTGALVEWGHLASGTAESTWRFVGYLGSTATASTTAKRDQWRCTQSTDSARTPILGRPLGALPGLLGDPSTLPAVKLLGVASGADTLTVEPRYDFPIEAIDPRRSPSRRRVWRSTDTTEQFIAWELDETYTAGDLRCLGIYLAGCNFRTAILQYHDGANWTDLVGIDLASSVSLTLARSGTTVTTSTSVDWLQQNEAVGGSVVFSSGDVREIEQNDAGCGAVSWSLSIAGTDGTEAAGTGALWLTQGFAMRFTAQDIRRLRLRLPAQTTASGVFQIGVCAIGRVYALGLPHDWGTTESSTPDVRAIELPGFSLLARRAPPAKRWGVQWPLANLESLRSSTADFFAPDGSASLAFGLLDDLYPLIRGLVEEAADTVPVLLLPALDTADNGQGYTDTELRKDVLWFGRIDGAQTVSVVVGDEGSSSDAELQRVGQLTMQEIV